MKSFNVDGLLRTAMERTGLSDFGPADFMEGLTVLVDGINREVEIRADRWDRAQEHLLRLLVNRLRFARDLSDHPEIADEDVGSPIVIVSLPRTGTTKLQRMLSASDVFQTHKFWQEYQFARAPGRDDGGQAERIQATREFENWMYVTSPGILTGHPVFTDEPDEDMWLMEYSFREALLFGVFGTPSYAQWLAQADKQPSYDYLLAQLKYLQWQTKPRDKKPWLLKAPNHLGSERQLTRIFKNPRFIFTHRDPAKCMPSVTATAIAMRKLYSDCDESSAYNEGVTGLYFHLLGEHMKWRDDNPGIQILDLRFRDVTEDGMGTARKVFDFFGMPLSAAAESSMRNWEQNNNRDKHGKSVYSAKTLGTTEADIRLTFKAYMDRYAEFI